ncbi:MAG: hypothetical protein U0790_00990 [Isosphaeraceae bacterium]
MSLSTKIVAALDNLAGTFNPAQALSAREGDHQITLDLAVNGPVGFSALALEFLADGPERTIDQLKDWADRVAGRVTYLMEPLRVVEIDPVGVEVELRSAAPSQRANTRAYYEVRLRRNGTLNLARVVFDNATRTRRDEAFQMTRDVIERLTDDLVDTAG